MMIQDKPISTKNITEEKRVSSKMMVENNLCEDLLKKTIF